MKLTRIAATGATLAMIGGSILFAGTAATAESGGTAYYSASDFGTEGTSYPTGWFIGEGSADNSLESVDTGLQITGLTQILNGSADTADLNELVTGADFTVASGDATFQVSLFATPTETDKGFTTIRPVDANTLDGEWTLSRSVNALVAGQSYSLADLVEGLGTEYQILAYGAFVDGGSTAVVESITWDGVTSVFTPEPAPVDPVTPVDPAAPGTPVSVATPATPVAGTASFTG